MHAENPTQFYEEVFGFLVKKQIFLKIKEFQSF
jgi:hypothetical protein